MLAAERHRLILAELELKNNVTVMELKDLLHVSVDTIRRDLSILESEGKLQKVHGGATVPNGPVTNQTYSKRTTASLDKKQELARYAAELVRENEAVCLNAGTTNIEVAKRLAFRFERLTVITNSIMVVEALARKPGFTIILAGGVFDPEEHSLHGSSVENEISKYNIDVSFVSINAISLARGLTDFRQGEPGVIHAMIQSSRKTIVVADSGKFETVSYLNVCPLNQIQAIVTDSHLDDRVRQLYENNGIAIMNASRH